MKNNSENVYEYTIVGAGPAAICAVAKLLSKGVAGKDILGIDPEFKVGDFGTRWKEVPGNTKVKRFQFVNNAIYKILDVENTRPQFAIDSLPEDETCALKMAAEPMQYITNCLRERVDTAQGRVTKITHAKQHWEANCKHQQEKIYKTKRIILAVGANLKIIPLPVEVEHLSYEQVADKSQLDKIANSLTKVAVIGSSHSAALAAMHLTECDVPVMQFTNKEYLYAESVTLDDGTVAIKNDNTGLKGVVAQWTRANENKIETYSSNNENYLAHLPECSHVVFAVGFEPNNDIEFTNHMYSKNHYDVKTSKIAEGLFGLGLAYPLEITDVFNETAKAVGYGKFWGHLNDNILNIWNESTAAELVVKNSNDFFPKAVNVTAKTEGETMQSYFQLALNN